MDPFRISLPQAMCSKEPRLTHQSVYFQMSWSVRGPCTVARPPPERTFQPWLARWRGPRWDMSSFQNVVICLVGTLWRVLVDKAMPFDLKPWLQRVSASTGFVVRLEASVNQQVRVWCMHGHISWFVKLFYLRYFRSFEVETQNLYWCNTIRRFYNLTGR